MADEQQKNHEHHWTMTPMFIVTVLAALIAVVTAWFTIQPPDKHPPSTNIPPPFQTNIDPAKLPPPQASTPAQDVVPDKVATKFETMRDELVAIIQKGPEFVGNCVQRDQTESPVAFTIHWDDNARKGFGEIRFPSSGRKIKVGSGMILMDKENPGHVVLRLTNPSYDNNCVVKLKAAKSGQDLTGTYQGYNKAAISLTLHPAPSEQ